MRIKKFIAKNMSEAIEMVRQSLGSDAIILSNQTINGQVELTAGLDENIDFAFSEKDEIEPLNTKIIFDETFLRENLNYHNLVDFVQSKILATARQVAHDSDTQDRNDILSQTFDEIYNFCPVLNLENQVKMFMGTPGSGKSTAIAKVATQAKIKGIRTLIISVDNVRAGANKQLESFANILELNFLFIKDPRSLFETIKREQDDYKLILIDTPGVNPFLPEEVNKVESFSESIKCDKILILDAGRNAFEAVEVAEIFVNLGAKYLIPTRMDLTRRLGTILSVADCCKLTFCSVSVSSSIANGLATIDSKSLSKLILN